MAEITEKVKVDCRGMHCPAPVVMMRRNLAKIEQGEVMLLVATDPATQRDIPPASESMGLELLKGEAVDSAFVSESGAQYEKEYRYYLKKK